MKSQEELNALKSEVEALSQQLSELDENELEEVTSGINIIIDPGKVEPMVVCTNIIKEDAEKSGTCSQGPYCPSRSCRFATKNK